jgi:NADH-quinone oxidoreductase subunit M
MNILFQPLTLVTFFPLVGVLVILLLPREQKNAIRWTALITSLITFGISLRVLSLFNPQNPDLQLVINIPWIEVAGLNISYQMGIDGLSILLLLLTTLLTPMRSSLPGQQSKNV